MSITKSNEFARIPWAIQMQHLAQILRASGHAIPEGATVHLIPVPEHLRNDEGKPLFRIAVYDPDQTDDALTEHLHEGVTQ